MELLNNKISNINKNDNLLVYLIGNKTDMETKRFFLWHNKHTLNLQS